MSRGLRWSEKWFRFGLWLVAFVFGGFLIGLGGTIVENLPRVEQRYTQEDFIDRAAAATVRTALKETTQTRQSAQDGLDQARLGHRAAQANSATARQTFNTWLSTRHATQRPEQDPELIARSQELDQLAAAERKALAGVEKQQQILLDAQQAEVRAQKQLHELEETAREALQVELRRQELRVFIYRLALTLPLLGIAGWLFAKKRQSTWWPFVWGFIYFALFAFFVELVPYIPSYGGWVRYTVGIVITALVGR
ncbi:MAG TPA: serine endopeptidase, partial [Azonexus sp.]